ncbi:hypothetical protein VP01_873g3 [Puccinia sorghi]|uniref:Uncharacterized protein n=1 Tax=Puccinia sorghi TaxID=27349 RepID=A0A0L6UAS4_9BASI|nr:hypothetical protein VP01_873g3 [Puccinia sorghi]
MICHFALIIALLYLEPSRGALTNPVKSMSQTTAGHKPLIETRDIKDVDLISREVSREIHKSYSQSHKRLILLDDDVSLGTIKPFRRENSAYDQKRMTRALKKLSEDPKNEVWIITDRRHVGVLENAYGHIPGLHLAGYEGTDLGENHPPGIVLAPPDPLIKLRNAADGILNDLGITQYEIQQYYLTQQYFIDYFVPSTSSEGMPNEHKVNGILGANGYVGEMTEMKKNLEAMIQSDQRYRGCQVKVAETPEEFRVMLSHQDQFNKGTLAEALFRKHEHDDEPIDFGLSIGDRQMDEPMHQAMRAHGYHAIVVKGKDGNNFDPWPTASGGSGKNQGI